MENLCIDMVYGFYLDKNSTQTLLNLDIIFTHNDSYCFYGNNYFYSRVIDNNNYTLNIIEEITDKGNNHYLGFYKSIKTNDLSNDFFKNTENIPPTNIMTIDLKLLFPNNSKIQNGDNFEKILSIDIKPKLMLMKNDCCSCCK
jgi:hypothetical protein